jgi:two-component system LytT family sensor kinase
LLKFSSTIVADKLHITIRNTGVLGDKEASGGFGLANTAQRLELLYGPEATDSIFFRKMTDITQRLCAEITIPTQSEGYVPT